MLFDIVLLLAGYQKETKGSDKRIIQNIVVGDCSDSCWKAGRSESHA